MSNQQKRRISAVAISVASVLGGWVSCGAVAQAQQAPASPAPPESQAAVSATGQLQEITVTANRRREPIQNVPLAIAAISGDTANKVGVTDAQSLAEMVPGMTFNRQANASLPFLRGVGTPVGEAGDEPSVALYVDDVYMPAGSASMANFTDIERMEVDKGPQGTLFGRNATGGVVQVFTRDPSQTPVLDATVGYANYDTWSANTYASGPISPTLLGNVSMYWSNQSQGWGRNVTTGETAFRYRDLGGRTKLLWNPTGGTSAMLELDFDKTVTQEGLGFVPWPGTGSLDPLPPFPNGGFPPAPGYYDPIENYNSDGFDKQFGVSLHLSQDLDWAQLVSISAYRDTRADYYLDEDSGPLPLVNAIITTLETTYTQEFQLKSQPSSSTSWIAGIYYFNDKAGFEPLDFTGLSFAPFPYVDAYGVQTTQSYSAYAQATRAIVSHTHLTLGARYTKDDRTERAYASFAGSPDVPASNSPLSKSWASPTWRVVLDHDFTPDVMAYVGYNRGFKSGLFNPVVLPGSPIDKPVNPETLDAYTVGLKSEYLDHRLRFNVEGFYYNYKNIQVDQILSGVTHITNAARAMIKGVDVDISVIPMDRLTLTASLEGMKGIYESFPDGTFFAYSPVTGGNCTYTVEAPCPGVTPPNYNPTTGQWDLRGNHTIDTPPFSMTLIAKYVIPSAIGPFDLNVSWSHTGNYFASPDNGEGQIAPSSPSNDMQGLLNLINGSIGWTSRDESWEARLWGKNLTNKEYWSYVDETAFSTQYSPAPPRTYGVQITKHFE